MNLIDIPWQGLYQTLLGVYKSINVFGILGSLVATVLLAPLFRWMSQSFRNLTQPFECNEVTWVPSLSFKKFELLSKSQIASVFVGVLKALNVFSVLMVVYLYLSLVFSFFPATQQYSSILLGFVSGFFVRTGISILNYLPNLFSIVIIVTVSHYIVQLLQKILSAVGEEKVLFKNFHKEWAEPTFKLARFIVLLLVLVMVFPLLPGFQSPAFQGIGVFVGLLVSLGSSSAIGNVIAGMVLIYMRSFKEGDRIKSNDVTGDVIEKTLLVTKIRTIQNEVVSLPNSTVLTNALMNYSEEADTRGLILTTTVTIGYDVPWPEVHRALIEAAKRTALILDAPEPHVFQKSLDDFYVSYELRAYTRNANAMAKIYSDVHANIQNTFAEGGIEIMSPHYRAHRQGPNTIPATL